MIPKDQRQRDQALNPSKSFLVQAPAGSGKTELLTQRYLCLLAKAQKVPEEIVAITFTKKAANEMRERILQSLLLAKTPAPKKEHAKKTWELAKAVLQRDKTMGWQLLDNVNRLRITTIDALCASITTQMPILSKMGTNVSVSENSQKLYQEAVKALWQDLEKECPWQADLACLLEHLDNRFDRLEALLVEMLGKREQWLQVVTQSKQSLHFSSLKIQMEGILQKIIYDQLHVLQQSLKKEQKPALLESLFYALSNLEPGAYSSENGLDECLFGQDKNTINTWKKVVNIILNQKGQPRARVTKSQGFLSTTDATNSEEKEAYSRKKNAALSLFSHLEMDFLAHLHSVERLPDPHFSKSSWQLLESLLSLLPVLVAHLRLVFSHYRCVDFNEISLCAQTALGEEDNPTDVALSLDYQIRHLLVDEFQDTSRLHFRLLRALTYGWEENDGRTLFLVGDPMQSIYRFRQADVGLFLKVKAHGIGGVALNFVALTANFRSEKPIVDWVNTYFKQVFPEQDHTHQGAIRYHGANVVKTEHAFDSAVNWHLANNQDHEAQLVLKKVLQHVKDSPSESLAILVRSRAHLNSILPLLKTSGVRFSAVDLEPLCDKLAIRDVISLTYALNHLGDTLSWFCVLRAPWCGLSLKDLTIIRHYCDAQTVLSALADPNCTERLTHYATTRIAWFLPIINHFLAERDRHPLAIFVKKCWQALGGEKCLTSPHDYDEIMRFFELLATQSEATQLPERSVFEQHLNKLFAKAEDADDITVFVMTIHKSKGLEFDHVIVPGLSRRAKGDSMPLLLWQEKLNTTGDQAVLFAPIKRSDADNEPIYDYLFHIEKQRASQEIKRLLYVAITRAKKRVELMAVCEENEQNHLKIPAKESFLGHLWPYVGAELNELWSKTFKQNTLLKQQSFALDARATNQLARLPDKLLTPWQHQPTKAEGLNHPVPATEEAILQRTIGIIVHAYLANIGKAGLSAWPKEKIDALDADIKQKCQKAYVTDEDIALAIASVKQALRNILEDKTGRWILTAHHKHQVELVLFSLHNGRPKEHIIDRTFIDEAGIRWIIDYKTSSPSRGMNSDEFLRQEKETYLPQLQRYATLMQAMDGRTRKISLALYFPICQKMIDWQWQPSSQSMPLANSLLL